MDVLDQVAPRIGVGLIGPRQPVDRARELGGGRHVALVLSGLQVQLRSPPPFAEIVRRER
jgi:hypothetical protein